MSTSSSTKRVFGLLSCVSIAGAWATFATVAHAACPDPAPTTIPAYKPAHAVPGACTAADITFYAEAYEDVDTYPTYKSLQTALAAQSATCAACMFTEEGDAEQGAVVLEAAADGDGDENPFAYFEKAGSKACAETIYKWDYCAGSSCAACASEGDLDQCLEDVDDAAFCGGYDYETACPNFDTLFDELDDPVKVATALCGATAPTPDAGASSSSGSSGNSSSGSSGSTDDDDDDDTSSSSSSSSSGSSGGKKKGSSSSSSSSSGEATPSDGEADDAGGCAQGRGSAGGSIASALVLAAAVGAAASRRRRKP